MNIKRKKIKLTKKSWSGLFGIAYFQERIKGQVLGNKILYLWVFFTNKILFATMSHLSCFLVLVISLFAITPCHTDHPRVIEPWQLRRTTTSRAFGFQEGFPQLYEQFPHYTSLVGDTLYTNSNVLCTPTRYIVSSSWWKVLVFIATRYQVHGEKFCFLYQLDRMYQIGVHSVSYAHQLGTLYRVGQKIKTFCTNSTMDRVGVHHCVLSTPTRYSIKLVQKVLIFQPTQYLYRVSLTTLVLALGLLEIK